MTDMNFKQRYAISLRCSLGQNPTATLSDLRRQCFLKHFKKEKSQLMMNLAAEIQDLVHSHRQLKLKVDLAQDENMTNRERCLDLLKLI